MTLVNTRRRVLAGMAACGLGTIGGVGRAPAQEVVPCQVSSTGGTVENGEPNYWATATRAEFAFLGRMRAMGENIVLFAEELGGEVLEGVAAIKAVLVRDGDGPLSVETLQIQWPFTAVRHEGQLYNIIHMAHEQNAPIGIVLSAGGNVLGEIVFEPGKFDPNQPVLGFDQQVGQVIHDGLMRNEGFSIRVVSGGVYYSAFEPDTARYSSFIKDTLVGAMNEAARRDAEEPCRFVSAADHGEYLDGLEDCFLTSACCSVIGLSDDCWELDSLRRFRDGYMMSFAQGRADVERYYAEAPAVAQRLVSHPDGRLQLLGLYWTTILPAVLLARAGFNRAAYALYRRMMVRLLPAAG